MPKVCRNLSEYIYDQAISDKEKDDSSAVKHYLTASQLYDTS